jgi:acyl-coenzyme A thioesterase PaaI-like protein
MTFWDVPDDPGGAWEAKRALARELRELVALCVTTDAPEHVLREAAEAARALNERLRPFPRRTFGQQYVAGTDGIDMAAFADRGTLVGRCNPFAPPVRIHAEADVAVGLVTFGPPYEGAPGFVHGGIVAAVFDQVFGWLQVRRGVASLTGTLSVRYRRPTPLETPIRLEARFARQDGRKHHVTARAIADGVVTAEADSVFIEIAPDRMHAMFTEE